MYAEKFSRTFNGVNKDFDKLEFDFEMNFLDDTYLYNNINVFISSFDIEKDSVVIKSCDERPILNNLSTLNISVNEFLKIA